MQKIVWKKLIVNAAINAIATLLNETNSITCQNEYSKRAIEMLVLESLAVANAHGIDVDNFKVQDVYNVAESTGTNICSMLADIRAGNT